MGLKKLTFYYYYYYIIILSAIDKAFKMHYVFNLSYAEKAEHVWQFLQKVAFGIQDTTTTFSEVLDFQAFLKS